MFSFGAVFRCCVAVPHALQRQHLVVSKYVLGAHSATFWILGFLAGVAHATATQTHVDC
jgi:hypothetical protein